METFFTSDLHLGHENILTSRPQFHDIEEMDAYIIDRWNETVSANDEVYILGDLIYRNKKPSQYYLEQLKGRKHLIIGNHDGDWMKKLSIGDMFRYFISVDKELYVKKNRKRYTLSHYPWLEFSGSGYLEDEESNAYMIHGHIHALKSNTYKIIKEYLPFNLNCGQDICNFKPVTLEELIEINDRWYERKRNTVKEELR